MATQCILCQKNPPIKNSHVMPKFIIRYLKDQSPMPYLKNSWHNNQKYQDGLKGAYLCSECDNVTVSKWESYFKINWFDSFIYTQKVALLVDEEILSFLLSLLLRYSAHFVGQALGRSDSHLLVNLQNRTRELLHSKQFERIGCDFHIYSAFIHPITYSQVFLPGINQLLFNSYNCVILPPEDQLPSIAMIWIPSFLFVFSEISLEEFEMIKPLDIFNSMKINTSQNTTFQNWGLLHLVKSVLNKQTNNMNVSQRTQPKLDFNEMRVAFQNDKALSDKMSDKALHWDRTLQDYQSQSILFR